MVRNSFKLQDALNRRFKFLWLIYFDNNTPMFMFYGLVSVLCCVWSVSCSRHEFIWQGLHWCSPPPGWLVACCSWNKQYQYEAAPCYASEVSRVMHASLAPKWVKLSQNGKNPGLFQIRFRAVRQNVPKSDLKKSRIFPILGQFDPLWGQNWQPWVESCSAKGRPPLVKSQCPANPSIFSRWL